MEILLNRLPEIWSASVPSHRAAAGDCECAFAARLWIKAVVCYIKIMRSTFWGRILRTTLTHNWEWDAHQLSMFFSQCFSLFLTEILSSALWDQVEVLGAKLQVQMSTLKAVLIIHKCRPLSIRNHLKGNTGLRRRKCNPCEPENSLLLCCDSKY